MAGYPNAPPNYGGYGPPPSYPYTTTSTSHGVPPPTSQPPYATPYGAPSAPYAPHPGDNKPPKEKPGNYSSSGPPSGYPSMPPPPSGYGNSPPPPSAYGSSHPPPPSAYGSSPPPPSGYGSSAPPPSGYGSSPPPPSAYGGGPPSAYGGGPPSGYGTSHYGSSPPPAFGSPFASLVPSQFPPGTDPNVVACFQLADRDGSGFIDDKELQSALSSYNQSFSIRTVRLLMYSFTNTNTRKIGPKEFTAVFYSLQNWRAIFERFDRDRSGRIDMNELREALLSLGFSVSPVVLELLVSKFDKSGGRNQAIEYDNFIECCLTVKGLTEKFKEKDTSYSGSATFSYEAFMLSVLPFLIA